MKYTVTIEVDFTAEDKEDATFQSAQMADFLENSFKFDVQDCYASVPEAL